MSPTRSQEQVEWPGVTHEWIFLLIKGTIARAKKLSPPEISYKIYSTRACSVVQSCLTLGNPMVCSLPGSSVHRVFQARILEWVAMPSSKGSSQPRNWTTSLGSPALAGGFITTESPGGFITTESPGKHLLLLSLCKFTTFPSPPTKGFLPTVPFIPYSLPASSLRDVTDKVSAISLGFPSWFLDGCCSSSHYVHHIVRRRGYKDGPLAESAPVSELSWMLPLMSQLTSHRPSLLEDWEIQKSMLLPQSNIRILLEKKGKVDFVGS